MYSGYSDLGYHGIIVCLDASYNPVNPTPSEALQCPWSKLGFGHCIICCSGTLLGIGAVGNLLNPPIG